MALCSATLALDGKVRHSTINCVVMCASYKAAQYGNAHMHMDGHETSTSYSLYKFDVVSPKMRIGTREHGGHCGTRFVFIFQHRRNQQPDAAKTANHQKV